MCEQSEHTGRDDNRHIRADQNIWPDRSGGGRDRRHGSGLRDPPPLTRARGVRRIRRHRAAGRRPDVDPGDGRQQLHRPGAGAPRRALGQADRRRCRRTRLPGRCRLDRSGRRNGDRPARRPALPDRA